MITLNVYNIENEKINEIGVKASIFGSEVKEHLFYDAVRYQLTKKRSGTASVKNRAAVSGGGIKPWRQKGTGRARAGSRRSPLWTGGGIIFGPTPRSYEHKINKKIQNIALRSAISMKKTEDNLRVIEDFILESPKTRLMKVIFDRLGLTEKCLVVVNIEEHGDIIRAARNLANVKLIDYSGLNVYDILLHQKLIFLRSTLKRVEENLDK